MSVDQPPPVEYFDRWYADMVDAPAKDEIIRRHLGLPPHLLSTSLLPWDGIAEVTAALTPGEPRPPEEWATIDAIVSVTTYPDGQVGALVLNTDPAVAGGDQVLDYFRFEPVADGGYKVSQVILDPYDMTAGYGFEKAA